MQAVEPDYFYEPPTDDPPALVGCLYRGGISKPEDLTASLMDLVRRGYLTTRQITQGGEGPPGFVFQKVPDFDQAVKRRPLLGFEAALVEWAFDRAGNGSMVTDAELFMNVRVRGDEFKQWWGSWRAMVMRMAETQGWFSESGAYLSALVFLGGIGGILAGLFLAGTASPIALPALGLGIALAFASRLVPRRTPTGNAERKKWEAFRRYLLDFSEMRRMPPQALAIWEHYLVYAIPLGVAPAVLRGMWSLGSALEDPERRAAVIRVLTSRGGPFDRSDVSDSMALLRDLVSRFVRL